MTIINAIEIANRAEEKADFAVKRSEEASNGWMAIAADVTKLHRRFDATELLMKQALQEFENHKITHLRVELQEAQRRLDSLRAGEVKAIIERSKQMNNKWITGIGVACGALGVALEFLAQQHVGGAIAMALGVALASLGKSFLGSGQ